MGVRFYDSNPLEDIDSREFRIGREFLFVIRDREKVQGLGGCGESFVLIEDDMVKGRRLSDTGYEAYSMPLKTIIEEIKERETKQDIEEKLNDKKRKSEISLLERLRIF